MFDGWGKSLKYINCMLGSAAPKKQVKEKRVFARAVYLGFSFCAHVRPRT
jgi:hypothetical protein